jgi:hypothetical protein
VDAASDARRHDRGEPPPDAAERAARRHKLFEPVELLLDRSCSRAHLLNISATGALVHNDNPPGPGARIRLKLDGAEQEARVIWRDGRRIGVRFEIALTARTLRSVLR